MRAFLLTSLVFALSSSSGCMVLEEVDAAAAKMPSAKRSAAAEEEASTTTSVADKGNALLEQSRQWWQEARSLAPTGLESTIGRCRFPGSTQYMSEDDCRSRGGTPGRAAS